MRFRGGYNILLKGRPDNTINVMPEPKILYIPLCSDRLRFNDILVRENQQVACGDILAKDDDNFGVPLFAPRAGTVRLKASTNHIVLENIAQRKNKEQVNIAKDQILHIKRKMGEAGIKRNMLLSLGALQFFYDAFTGKIPDPFGKPQAIIVSNLSLEPFVTRGDVLLQKKLLNFTRGLEQLQSLVEYQPIYLVMPQIKSDLANLIRNQLRGYASIKMLEVPLIYPYDNFTILARKLGLKSNNGPVWAVRTEGVLAVDTALTLKKPCIERIISIGGIGVNSPSHLRVITGYPIKYVTKRYVFEPAARILNGGILTGKTISDKVLGIETECRGLTILPELECREFLGFIRPGWNRSSYAKCFLSSLRKSFRENFTTAVKGELRPCISCNFCEEVCPAGIMPYLIHKYLYADLIEEVEQARVDLCVECGLCSYVCPSKIDLRKQLIDAKTLIAKEKEELRQEELLQEEARKQSLEKTE
ncbi:4Fe-4S dicluster domain-containing protein [Planctomycetota bacterium]